MRGIVSRVYVVIFIVTSQSKRPPGTGRGHKVKYSGNIRLASCRFSNLIAEKGLNIQHFGYKSNFVPSVASW